MRNSPERALVVLGFHVSRLIRRVAHHPKHGSQNYLRAVGSPSDIEPLSPGGWRSKETWRSRLDDIDEIVWPLTDHDTRRAGRWLVAEKREHYSM